jgi:Universal stress protein family
MPTGAVSPGGLVRLLHVLEPSSLLPTRSIQVVAQAEERLRAQVPADAVARGIQTEVAVIEESDVAQAIRQEAERFGAHLVCIGSHSRSGLAKAILGELPRMLRGRVRARCWRFENHPHDHTRTTKPLESLSRSKRILVAGLAFDGQCQSSLDSG